MGACDTGRCCKGIYCTDDRKCCCTAGRKGRFTAGQVCRTSSCQYASGNCDNNVNVCECEANGGTLTQSCDPCANVVCDPKKCEQCVNGQCVTTCTACQQCESSGIVGVCVPKTCPPCQQCISGLCVPYGDPCGFPVSCCSDSECCVNGICVPKACSPPCGACKTCVCGSCVNSGECASTADCTNGKVCVNCQCVPPTCCVYVPTCGPHGVLVIQGAYTCETVTYDYMGTPCTETRYPLDCADSFCSYIWNGTAWTLEGCGLTTTQGLLLLTNDSCCSSAGCPSTLTASAGSYEGERRSGISCENPLP